MSSAIETSKKVHKQLLLHTDHIGIVHTVIILARCQPPFSFCHSLLQFLLKTKSRLAFDIGVIVFNALLSAQMLASTFISPHSMRSLQYESHYPGCPLMISCRIFRIKFTILENFLRLVYFITFQVDKYTSPHSKISCLFCSSNASKLCHPKSWNYICEWVSF